MINLMHLYCLSLTYDVSLSPSLSLSPPSPSLSLSLPLEQGTTRSTMRRSPRSSCARETRTCCSVNVSHRTYNLFMLYNNNNKNTTTNANAFISHIHTHTKHTASRLMRQFASNWDSRFGRLIRLNKKKKRKFSTKTLCCCLR